LKPEGSEQYQELLRQIGVTDSHPTYKHPVFQQRVHETLSQGGVDKAKRYWTSEQGVHELQLVPRLARFGAVRGEENREAAWSNWVAAMLGEPSAPGAIGTAGPLMDMTGPQLLFTAVDNNNEPLVQSLLAAKVNATVQCGHHFQDTALHLAAMCGHVPLVKLLVQHCPQSSLDSLDSSAHTPLVRAMLHCSEASTGHQQTVQILLEKGADPTIPNSPDGSGWIWMTPSGAMEPKPLDGFWNRVFGSITVFGGSSGRFVKAHKDRKDQIQKMVQIKLSHSTGASRKRRPAQSKDLDVQGTPSNSGVFKKPCTGNRKNGSPGRGKNASTGRGKIVSPVKSTAEAQLLQLR